MSRPRLANLSYAQLLDIAVDSCKTSPELKNKADALIAEVAPLPSWCVDILLSPDLLPQLFSSLGLEEPAAAAVCTTWSHAYSRELRRRHKVDPGIVRRLGCVPAGLPARRSRSRALRLAGNGLCMLPGGVLAISSSGDERDDGLGDVRFIAAKDDSDPQALAACQASSLAAKPFERRPMGMALTNDGLLVCNGGGPNALYKFAKDGRMDELASVPVLAKYDQGFKRCAVHQQTQRMYAIAEDDHGSQALVLLDSNLQVVATVEEIDVMELCVSPLCDVAVHGDQVIVLTEDDHPEGSGLRLLDLDGGFLRTIGAEYFDSPQAVAASHGTAFVVDNDDGGGDKLLLVIDLDSGDLLQEVPFDLHRQRVSGILVDGDEIYIVSHEFQVVVLQLAGSDA